MNKAELIDTLINKCAVTRKQAEDMIDGFTDTVMATLKSGGEVTIAGFGTFSARTRTARMGVNPLNPSERIQIPEVRVPKFKAGKNLKEALKS
ncbi:TPA: DNA-binding protein [Patescibacteria group bacterium]|nr:DNA-binding protein [Patescibacteria group bacterium]HCU47785.1 DNA-binding protein [Patescibacteria group bacterium]